MRNNLKRYRGSGFTMSQKTIVTLVDDLTGEAAETSAPLSSRLMARSTSLI